MSENQDFQHLGGVLASVPINWGVDDSALKYRGIRFDWKWTRSGDYLVLRFDDPSKADFEDFMTRLHNDLNELAGIGVLNPASNTNQLFVEPELSFGKYTRHMVLDQEALQHTILIFGHAQSGGQSKARHLVLFHPNSWEGIGHYEQEGRRMGAFEIHVSDYTRIAALIQSRIGINSSWQILNHSRTTRLRVVASQILFSIGLIGLFLTALGLLNIMFGNAWPLHSQQAILWTTLAGIATSYILGMRWGQEVILEANCDYSDKVLEKRRRFLRNRSDVPARLSNIRVNADKVVRL